MKIGERTYGYGVPLCRIHVGATEHRSGMRAGLKVQIRFAWSSLVLSL